MALPVQVNSSFDYLADGFVLKVGSRVVVNFRNRSLVGVIVACESNSHLSRNKLKSITACIDKEPLLLPEYIDFLQWVSKYYHEPLGMVIATALPGLLKKSSGTDYLAAHNYTLGSGDPKKLTAKQKELYCFVENKKIVSFWHLLTYGFREKTIKALLDRELLSLTNKSFCGLQKDSILPSHIVPNIEQQHAIDSINTTVGFAAFLLEGITGSGKTQVYLEVIANILLQGKQALVLLPEIGLTPQTLQRFRKKFALPMAVLHSKLTDIERMAAWMQASSGEARLVIGTRSAIFADLPELGLIIVDEEHDSSFKQQSGLRYSARDLAVVRAKLANIKVVLGTATPSLESYYNVSKGRYQHLELKVRAGGAALPTTKIIDMRSKKLQFGLAPDVITAISKHLALDNQVLIFLNRRGFCPVLFCHNCGWSAKCERCDKNYTLHKGKNRLSCHSCGGIKPLMTDCKGCGGSDLCEVGLGTEKLSCEIQNLYPDVLVTRIDRDAISGGTEIDDLLRSAYEGKSQIIVGTQMLAKGHHLPKITLVVVVDADGALYSSDFKAVEKLVQTVIQVSGRAGREDLAGEVLVQTHFPDNKFLQCALDKGYGMFAKLALQERAQASMPPYGCLALLNAEANSSAAALHFLHQVVDSDLSSRVVGVVLIGPMMAIQQKKAGKYRANLLIHAMVKSTLHRYIKLLVEFLSVKKLQNARWFLDIDPYEIT